MRVIYKLFIQPLVSQFGSNAYAYQDWPLARGHGYLIDRVSMNSSEALSTSWLDTIRSLHQLTSFETKT